MYKIEKGKPFYYQLIVLKAFYIIPDNITKLYPTSFWVKYILRQLFFMLFTCVSPVVHIVMSTKNKTGVEISEDISLSIGCAGGFAVCCLLTLQYEKWAKIMNDIVSLTSYREVPNFQKHLILFNRLAIIYTVFCVSGTVTYGIVALMESSNCKVLNKQNGLHEVCGSFSPIWLPFDSTNAITAIIFLLQMISFAGTLTPAAITTILTLQCTEILVIHINQLNEIFTNLFEAEEVSHTLRFCVNYHCRILSLGRELNIIVKHTLGHVFLIAAIVFGVIANQMLRSKALAGGLFLIGYVVGIFICCCFGQRMKDKTLSVGDAIIASNWYKSDAKTMRDLTFVLLRSQKPICFDALPLGILEFPMFLVILRTSYSYLTLLSKTM